MTPGEPGAAAANAAAAAWSLPEPTLVRRGMNELYACGQVVLRVGHATAEPELAHELTRMLAGHGIRTVEPVAGGAGTFEGLAVTAWQRIAAVDAPVDWATIGTFVRRVHALDPSEVPSGFPVPDPGAFAWWDFPTMLADVAADIDAAALGGLTRTVERHAGWADRLRDGPVLCHGDVHPGNVVMTAAGAVLVDWDLLCRAGPAWDHAALLAQADRWGGDPAAYRAFAVGYGRSFAADPLALALGELRNVAATVLRVRAGRTDPVAAAEAERRLRFWRGDPTAPRWRAQ